MLNFNKPYIGNAIGWILKWIYSVELMYVYTPLQIKIYIVKRIFPFWMRIIGQTHGEYVFIHKNYKNTEKGYKAQKHEYIHVLQSREHGWWGLWFIIKYLWYLIIYGYENNPFEIEAREAENTTTP